MFAFQQLESRHLLAGADTVFLSAPSPGDGVPDEFVISRDANGDVMFSVGGLSGTLSGADCLVINGSSDDDLLTVDYRNGFFELDIQFDGAGQQTLEGDGLRIFGDGTTNATYTPDFSITGSGIVNADDGAGVGSTINFMGLEPVDISGMNVATLTLPGANDSLTIANGTDLSTGNNQAIQVTGRTGNSTQTANDGTPIEAAAFFNNQTVVIDTVTNGVDGADLINIAGGDNQHGNANLTIATGANADIVNFVDGGVAVPGAFVIDSVDADVSDNPPNPAFDITANALFVSAATFGDGGPNAAIDTAVMSLNVTTAALDGDQFINEADDVIDVNLNAGAGDVRLFARGPIQDADPNDDILATNLVLAVGNGIGDLNQPLHTNVQNLDVSNGAAGVLGMGSIFITEADGLTLTDLPGSPDANAVSGTGGGGEILTHGPLIIAGSAFTVGGMTYTSFDLQGTQDTLTVNAGVAVRDTNGALTLNAGDDLNLLGASSIATATTLTINGDFGDADMLGSTISLFGDLSAGTSPISVNGNTDDDLFLIGDGARTIDNILTNISLDGGGGTDTATIDDVGDTTGDAGISISNDGVGDATISGLVDGALFSADIGLIDFARVNVRTGDVQGDRLTVTPNALIEFRFDGNDPIDFPADELIYNGSGTKSITGPNSGTLSSPTVADVIFQEFEFVSATAGNLLDDVIDLGALVGGQDGAANDLLLQVDPTGTRLEILFDANVADPIAPALLSTQAMTSVRSVSIVGGADDDRLIVRETPGGLPVFNGTTPSGHTNPAFNSSGLTPAAGNIGLHFNGVAGVDSVRMEFTTIQNVAYFSDNAATSIPAGAAARSGVINVAGELSMSFENLAPIEFRGAGGTLTVDATSTPGTTTINLADDLADVAGAGGEMISGNGGVEDVFHSGFDGLTVRGGDGAELITLIDVDPNSSLTDITIDGDNTTGTDAANALIPGNAVDVQSLDTGGAVNLSVEANGFRDTVNFSGTTNTRGGKVDVNADGSISFDAAGNVVTGGGAADFDSGASINMQKGSVVDAGGGDVVMNAGFGVLLGRIVSPEGTVTIDAGVGGIADGSNPADLADPDGADIEALTAMLSAGTSIGTFIAGEEPVRIVIDTKVSNLDANVGGNGIFILNDGALIVENALAPNGIVEVATMSPLTVAGNVTAKSIRLTSLVDDDPNSPADNITLAAGSNVQATGGAVTLQAGNDVLIDALAHLAATSTIHLDARHIRTTVPPWQNPLEPLDANGDGIVAPNDVILIVNSLNIAGAGTVFELLSTLPAFGDMYLDINGDNVVAPNDVLLLVESLNAAPLAEGEHGVIATELGPNKVDAAFFGSFGQTDIAAANAVTLTSQRGRHRQADQQPQVTPQLPVVPSHWQSTPTTDLGAASNPPSSLPATLLDDELIESLAVDVLLASLEERFSSPRSN